MRNKFHKKIIFRNNGKETKLEQRQELRVASNTHNPSFIKKEASPIKVNMNLGEKIKIKNEEGKIFKKNASELQIDAIPDSREKSPLKPISSKQICKPYYKILFYLFAFTVNYREIRDAYKEQSHNNEGNFDYFSSEIFLIFVNK